MSVKKNSDLFSDEDKLFELRVIEKFKYLMLSKKVMIDA